VDDVFEPTYPPGKIDFWLDHFEELDTLVLSPKSSAHIAEHLAREWILLQVRLTSCLCKEQHAHDSAAVDPACSHAPSGGGAYRAGPETALCIVADLRRAASELPPHWLATRRIWETLSLPAGRARHTALNEPPFSRSACVQMMARSLGWRAKGESAA